MAKQLADYFGVSVEDLLDDSRDLPGGVFAEKIETLMLARGIEQEALAAAVEVPPSAVQDWLNGGRPRPAVMLRLADYFGITTDDLTDDSRELPKLPSRQGKPERAPPTRSMVQFATSEPSAPMELHEDPAPQPTMSQLISQNQQLIHAVGTLQKQVGEILAWIKSQGLQPPEPNSSITRATPKKAP